MEYTAKKFVEVMWIDAVPGDNWVTIDDLPEPRIMRTRGWLIAEHNDYIVLAGTLDADNGFYGETLALPRGMIDVMHELKITPNA